MTFVNNPCWFLSSVWHWLIHMLWCRPTEGDKEMIVDIVGIIIEGARYSCRQEVVHTWC